MHDVVSHSFLFSDVLEFLQDINADDLSEDLQVRYHKLLENVSSVFTDPDEEEDNDEEEEDDNTRFGGEDETNQQMRYEEDDDGADDDDSVPIPFRNGSTNDRTWTTTYMSQASSENQELYDETNANQDYEVFSFSKCLNNC